MRRLQTLLARHLDIVTLGGVDGSISVLGLVVGLSMAMSATQTFIAGTTAAAAAATSMAAGEYLTDEGHSPRGAILPTAIMFISSALMAMVPVVPFAFLAAPPARLCAIAITAITLTGLGLERASANHQHPLRSITETLGVAALAALAGIAVARLA